MKFTINIQTNAARISRHLQPSCLRRWLTKSRGYNVVGGCAITFCILGGKFSWSFWALVTDFLFSSKDVQEFFRIKICPLHCGTCTGTRSMTSPGSLKSSLIKIQFNLRRPGMRFSWHYGSNFHPSMGKVLAMCGLKRTYTWRTASSELQLQAAIPAQQADICGKTAEGIPPSQRSHAHLFFQVF